MAAVLDFCSGLCIVLGVGFVIENNEVKDVDATKEKVESNKVGKEFDAAKCRIITIALTGFLIIAATVFFVITFFHDDSGRSLIEYIEQGEWLRFNNFYDKWKRKWY